MEISYAIYSIDSVHRSVGQINTDRFDPGSNKPTSHNISLPTENYKFLRLTIFDSGLIDRKIISDIYITIEQDTSSPNPDPEPDPEPDPKPEPIDYTTILNTIVSRLDTNNT